MSGTEPDFVAQELDALDCGRLIAALEAYAEDHPDADEAETYLALARVILRNDVFIAARVRDYFPK